MSYDSSQDDRLFSLLAYLLSLPLSIVAPLIIFLVKKDQSRFVAFHALQAVFIHLAFWVVCVAAMILSVLFHLLGPLAILALLMVPFVGLIGLAGFVFTIVAAIKSFNGEWYKVPILGDFVPVRQAV